MIEGWAGRLDAEVEALDGLMVRVRRHLHRHPEPSRAEFDTAGYIASTLADAGVPHRLIASRRGLIAGGAMGRGGPCVAIRADIDALPIVDAKAVAYRSTRPGLMHACGHDAHAAMVLGAALALQRAADALPEGLGWRAIFQPSEEVGEGAAEMVAEGALEGVDAILALHVDPALEVGRVGVRDGVLTAFCQSFEANVRGRGAHAARPHLAADPIAAAAQLVAATYQAIPRSHDARAPVVVSFGAIAGGASANVIPDRVRLLGTVRTLGNGEGRRVRERLAEVARGVGLAFGVEIDLEFGRALDAVVNDPRLTSALAAAAAAVVGPGQIERIALPSMGGEDFSGYLARVPGCMLRLGVAPGPGPAPGLHDPAFDVDERALALGARILARGAVAAARAVGVGG